MALRRTYRKRKTGGMHCTSAHKKSPARGSRRGPRRGSRRRRGRRRRSPRRRSRR